MGAKTIKGITVEINGETTGLGKVLDEAKKKSIGLNKELKQVNAALKFDPSNTKLLAEKQKVLADSVKAASDELKVLKDAQEQVEAQYKAGEIDRGAYLEFQNKLRKAEENLKRLKQEQQDFGGVVATVMKNAGAAVEDFGEKIQGAGEKMQEVGGQITNVGEKLLPVTGAIVAAGTASTKMAWDFEDSMAKVATIADTTEVPLAELERQILELSDETGVAAGEIAENVYNAISAGQKTGDAVEFMRYTTDLARAGYADTGASLDVLTTIMNAYGLEAEKVTEVSDILIATQNLGKTTVAELSASMGKVIPTANAANVSLDQLAAGYAIMTANGVATAESTTYINSMLNELNKSGTTVAKTLKKETGMSFSELMAEGYSLGDVLGILSAAAEEQNLKFTDLFGSAEAGKAGLILLGNSISDVENGLVEAGGSTSQFNSMLMQIQAAGGGTATALDKLNTANHTISVSLNQVKNSAMGFGQTIGGILAPYIQQFAGWIDQATKKLNSMDDSEKKNVIALAALVAAVAPAIMAVGGLVTGIGKLVFYGGSAVKFFGTLIGTGGKVAGIVSGIAGAFKSGGAAASLLSGGVKLVGGALSFLAANPVALAIAGVVAVGAVLVTLYNKCEGFRNMVNAIGSGIAQGWNAAMEGLKNAANVGMEALKATTTEKLNNIKAAYTENGGGIKGIVAATMTGIQEAQTFGLDFIDNLTGGKLTAIAGKFRTGMESARLTTSNMMENIRGTFSTKIENARSTVSQGLDNIRSAFSSKLEGAKTAASNVMDNIKATFSEKIEAARTAVENGISKIKNAFNFSWSLPHLNLPHISVSGGVAPYGIGGKGSLPKFHIEWYKEGGILNGAQIFGTLGRDLLGGGEAGPEAVLPLRSFYTELERILRNYLDNPGPRGGGDFYQYNTYNSPKELSPAECARQTRNETRKLLSAIVRG